MSILIERIRAERDALRTTVDILRAELAKLEFELEVAKTDELSAAVWAATETIKHDLWDAQAELITLKADLARYETTAENCDLLRATNTAVVLPSVDAVMRLVLDYQDNKRTNVTGTTNWAANLGMHIVYAIARLNAADQEGGQ